jgi:CRP-like cAMP-binding protein
MEGSVKLFSADNLFLKRVGLDELFGETSLIFGENRSLNAVAGQASRTVRKVPKSYISNIFNADLVVGSFLRNTQIRLMDSNEQRMDLANELEKVGVQMQCYFVALDAVNSDEESIFDSLLRMVRKFERFKQGAKTAAATEE